MWIDELYNDMHSKPYKIQHFVQNTSERFIFRKLFAVFASHFRFRDDVLMQTTLQEFSLPQIQCTILPCCAWEIQLFPCLKFLFSKYIVEKWWAELKFMWIKCTKSSRTQHTVNKKRFYIQFYWLIAIVVVLDKQKPAHNCSAHHNTKIIFVSRIFAATNHKINTLFNFEYSKNNL